MKYGNWRAQVRLLAHEEQRDLRRHQRDEAQEVQLLGADPFGQPGAVGAVADLVVVLHEGDERIRRQPARRLAAGAPVGRAFNLPVVHEAVGQRLLEVGDRVTVRLVVAAPALAGDEFVEHVVDVVVPLRHEVHRLVGGRRAIQPGGLVVHVLDDQLGVMLGAHRGLRQVAEELVAVLGLDLVHGVEAQSVEIVLGEPHHRVLVVELPHLLAIEVDARAPGRLHLGVEPLRRIGLDEIVEARRSGCRPRPAPCRAQAHAPGRPARAVPRACRRSSPARRSACRHSPSCDRPGTR